MEKFPQAELVLDLGFGTGVWLGFAPAINSKGFGPADRSPLFAAGILAA